MADLKLSPAVVNHYRADNNAAINLCGKEDFDMRADGGAERAVPRESVSYRWGEGSQRGKRDGLR